MMMMLRVNKLELETQKTGFHKKMRPHKRLTKCPRGLAPRAHQGHTFGRRRQVSSSAKKPLQTIGRSMAFRSPRTRKKTAHGWVLRFVSYTKNAHHALMNPVSVASVQPCLLQCQWCYKCASQRRCDKAGALLTREPHRQPPRPHRCACTA